jgi:peptidoglycan glycosyltransferase
MCVLFLLLAGYLSYFQFFVGNKIVSSPYNNRNQQLENDTLRGSILDRNGTVLAKSVKTGDKQDRIYPYGHLYSQIIGYNSKIYGKSLIEKQYNDYLLNRNIANPLVTIKNVLKNKEKTGSDVYLTIDHKIQALADSLIGNRNGAVVAMNPKTGEIIAMISKPDFDPGTKSLEANWQSLAESEDHKFLPRATQGLYNPGSTYKVVVSSLAVENGLSDLMIDDKGSVIIDGKPVKNQNGYSYGKIGMSRALSVSSNVYFSQIAVMLGMDKLKDGASRFGLGKNIPFDIPLTRSQFAYKDMSKADMAASGIGQGKVLVTPLNMAMITSTIANDGIMMRPTLVKRIATKDGIEIKSFRQSVLEQVIDGSIAGKVKLMMQDVVQNGTGKTAAIYGIHVAGKTGTAENELTTGNEKKQHSWFIGFAPVEDPQIAVAVVLEYNGSSGGSAAAPIAQRIMSEYINNLK